MAVGEWNLQRRIAWNHAQSVIGEMQVADNFGAKHARNVRSSGSVAPGSDRFGDAASADNIAAFEYESGISRARKICRRGQPVMACTYDNRVVNRVLDVCHQNDHWSKRRNTPVEETTESPLQKPLKNCFQVLYRMLTGGQ